jgi:hypothetical protein
MDFGINTWFKKRFIYEYGSGISNKPHTLKRQLQVMTDQTYSLNFLRQLRQHLRPATVLVTLIAIVYIFLIQIMDHGLGMIPCLIILMVVFISSQFFRLGKINLMAVKKIIETKSILF